MAQQWLCLVPATHSQTDGWFGWGERRGTALSDQYLLSTADPEYPLVGLWEKNMPLVQPNCQIFVSWSFYLAEGLPYFLTRQREAGKSDSWLQQNHLHLFHLFALLVILLMVVIHCTCNCDKLSLSMRWLFGDSLDTVLRRTQDS